MRSLMMVTVMVLMLAAATSGARAGGELNTFASGGWSPNSEWLALNWPDRKELFISSVRAQQ